MDPKHHTWSIHEQKKTYRFLIKYRLILTKIYQPDLHLSFSNYLYLFSNYTLRFDSNRIGDYYIKNNNNGITKQ